MERNDTQASAQSTRRTEATRRPRVNEIAATLRERIIRGELQPGQRLVEQTLANDLSVSRVPIREALHILRGEGFVSATPNRGMVVHPLSEQDVEDLFEVREVLEVFAVRRAAERATQWEIDQLQLALEDAAATLEGGTPLTRRRCNQSFHDILTGAAHNELLATLTEPIEARLQWLVSRSDHPTKFHEEHLEIFDAVRSRDADRAAAAALAHIHTSRELWRSAEARRRAAAPRER